MSIRQALRSRWARVGGLVGLTGVAVLTAALAVGQAIGPLGLGGNLLAPPSPTPAPAGIAARGLPLASPLLDTAPLLTAPRMLDDLVEAPTSVLAPTLDRILRVGLNQRVVKDELVVGLDLDVPLTGPVAVSLASTVGAAVVGSIPELAIYQFRFPGVRGVEELAVVQRQLRLLPGIAFVSRHFLSEGALTRIPRDREYDPWSQDWLASNWNLEAVRAPEAWDFVTGSKAVRVAIIDADFDAGHEDLASNVAFQAGRETRLDGATGSHGTHVASTACGVGNNGVGIAGVSWACSLQLLDFGAVSPVSAADQMVRAVNEGANVVNMSIQFVETNACGRPGTAEALEWASETNDILKRGPNYGRVRGREMLWVFAAGNECRDGRYASPASLTEDHPFNTIAVASVGRTGRLSPFSNYGRAVEVAAPGESVVGAVRGGYRGMAGTSMAAPHVSGLAALLYAVSPRMTAAQVKSCIVSTALQKGRDVSLVDAPGAVACARSDSGVSQPPQPFGGS